MKETVKSALLQIIVFLLLFLFFLESYVKLLISTRNLEKEKEEAMKEIVGNRHSSELT